MELADRQEAFIEQMREYEVCYHDPIDLIDRGMFMNGNRGFDRRILTGQIRTPSSCLPFQLRNFRR